MMRRFAYVVVISLVWIPSFGPAANAAMMLTQVSEPTPGLPDYTFTLTATETTGDKIIGFDFVGDGSFGIFCECGGQINQVNPFRWPTVFQDNNALFFAVGRDVKEDSQFKVISTMGTASGAFESSTKLQAEFEFSPAALTTATNVWEFAQLAIRNGKGVAYRGTFTVEDSLGNRRLEHVESINGFLDCIVPEPACAALAVIAAPGLMAGSRRRRRGTTGSLRQCLNTFAF